MGLFNKLKKSNNDFHISEDDINIKNNYTLRSINETFNNSELPDFEINMGDIDLDEIRLSSDIDSSMEQLNKIIFTEKIHRDYLFKYKSSYHNSPEYQINRKLIYEAQKEYIKMNPTDFLHSGALYFKRFWSSIDDLSDEENLFMGITGQALYYENIGQYEKALSLYEKASKIQREVYEEDFQFGGRPKTDDKIKSVKNKIKREKVKIAEDEAKKLEETDPIKAIEKYNELNKINPNLKKYNKRIAILERKLDKLDSKSKDN